MSPAPRRRFSSAKPFPHLVIDDFLEPGFARALASQFPAYDAGRFRDPFGRPGKASYPDLPSLGSAFRRLDAMTAGRAFRARLEELSGIEGLLHDPGRYRGAAHEYLGGMGLRPHLDFNLLTGKGWYRRLNVVLFLTPGWRPGWGGEVVLGGRGRARRAVAPLFNRCLIFATGEDSWHALRPVAAPSGVTRKSVTLYFYTAEPPPAEAPPRLTLWDFPPLPRSAEAGALVDERLWAALEEPFILRDAELFKGGPVRRRVRPSPLSGLLRFGAVLTRRDLARLRRALASRDLALERKWYYPERFLDEAIMRMSRCR